MVRGPLDCRRNPLQKGRPRVSDTQMISSDTFDRLLDDLPIGLQHAPMTNNSNNGGTLMYTTDNINPMVFADAIAAVACMLAVAREEYEGGERECAEGTVMEAVWMLEAFAHEVAGRPPHPRGHDDRDSSLIDKSRAAVARHLDSSRFAQGPMERGAGARTSGA
jgi:hypothetical protein